MEAIKMIEKVYDINFSNKGSEALFERIATGYIPIPPKKGIIIKKTSIRAEYHKLWIKITKCDPSIKIKNMSKLLVIKHEDKIANQFNDFIIQSDKYFYEIMLDLAQIEDYTNFQNSQGIIEFELKSQPKPTGEKKVDSFTLKLNFSKRTPHFAYDFEIESEFDDGCEYRKDKQVPLGSFRIENKSKHKYTHPMNCELIAQFEGDLKDKNIVYFGTEKKIDKWGRWTNVTIKESHRESSEDQNTKKLIDDNGYIRPRTVLEELSPKLEELSKVFDENLNSSELIVRDDGCIIIKNLLSGHGAEIPVYIDLEKLGNPVTEDSKHSATVFISYSDSGKKMLSKQISRDFILKKDKRTTKLITLFRETRSSSEQISCKDKDKSELSSMPKYLGKKEPGKYCCFEFEIANQAESGNGSVNIRNLHFTFEISGITPVQNCEKEDIFLITDDNNEKYHSEYRFLDARNSKKNFSIYFRHNKIEDIPKNIADIKCNVSFDYSECVSADDKPVNKSFSHNFVFQIEKYPGPYWLAIDFGTSAIVAAFDKNTHKGVELLNLQGSLETLMKRNDQEYTKEQIAEHGTNFLCSNILLKNLGVIESEAYESEAYKHDIIFLSPPYGEFIAELEFFLPYLKSLIGSDNLTDFNKEFNKYKYYVTKKDKEADKASLFEEKPLSIDKILATVYHSLLRDFILPALEKKYGESQKPSKLVLTVPNTFTPKHIDVIKKLIEEKIPQVNTRYLSFLSESDAVACYYVTERYELNKQNPRQENELNSLIHGREYVLVYDMGAGTIDLSYLEIVNKGREEQEINIIGKIGKSSAGNYFDYVLANCIYDPNNDYFNQDMIGDRRGRLQEYSFDFKKIIRDIIKPELDNTQDIIIEKAKAPFTDYSSFTDSMISDEIKIKDIKNHPDIQKFIKQNTEELFNNFFSLYSEAFDGKKREEGEFPIDTVIFSGRSIQFNAFQEAIIAELKKWNGNKNIFPIKNLSSDALKSVVVQGALQYALLYRDQKTAGIKFKSRNLNARYGFLYKDPYKNIWRFKELLNPSTPPSNPKPHFNNGMIIYEYDTDKLQGRKYTINMSATATAYFVQSYSSDTAEDMNNSNTEYITFMFNFEPDAYPCADIKYFPVSVKIDKNNKMLVSIGENDRPLDNPLIIDLKHDRTFKNSMWPYFQNN
jgi:hypothetical protein